MESIAYELASSEVGMVLDCAVCNAVTASTAEEYKRRITAIVADARLDADESEHPLLHELEETGLAYVDAQVDRYAKILGKEDEASLEAIASIPGAKRTACGFTVPGVHSVSLSRTDNKRLKSIVAASEDTHSALTIIKSMVEATASTVSYEFSVDSVSFLRSLVRGMPSDRTAKALAKAFGGLL